MEVFFQARVWRHEGGTGAWHFVTLPKRVSRQIRTLAAGKCKPGGSLPVTARIGVTRWKTSLFDDRKRDAYLLPLKAQVRAKEQLRAGELAEVTLMADLADAG